MTNDKRATNDGADARGPLSAEERRKARLADELRANLLRRKQQVRARRAGDPERNGED